MTAYLLEPKVRTVDFKFLTQAELNKLLKRIKQKKYGMKIAAVDVDEITVDVKEPVQKTNRFREKQRIEPGNYFNVHLEYVV